MSNLVAIGVKVVEHALLPPEIDTLEKGLRAMSQGWKMNTRNTRDAVWAFEKLDDSTFICTSSGPFPLDQEYGVLFGFCRRFAGNHMFTVSYEDISDRDNSDKLDVRFIINIE